jgi:hypothetical protein
MFVETFDLKRKRTLFRSTDEVTVYIIIVVTRENLVAFFYAMIHRDGVRVDSADSAFFGTM